MKICAIVTEYNPFHNGHKYQIEQIKKQTHCDYVIAIMSGNFVQRGEPAILDKWTRAKMALKNGIDLVIELPTLYATASSEYFAYGAVSTLDKLNCVDYLAFGAKCDDVIMLKKIACVLADEPDDFKESLQKELKNGVSFPAARSKCLVKHFKKQYEPKLIEETLEDPNNILAIEYLKALTKLNSSITPILVKRVGTDYNSLEINDGFASSTAIRKLLKTNEVKQLENIMPKESLDVLKEELQLGKNIMSLESFEKEILLTLRKTTTDELSKIADVSEGLEFAIQKAVQNSYDIESIIENIKSKRYTRTRIQRIIIHTLLNITDKLLTKYKEAPQYARILGLNNDAKKFLSLMSQKSSLPIVSSVSSFIKNATDDQKEMIAKDIEATNIYTLGYQIPSLRKYNLDYTTKIN